MKIQQTKAEIDKERSNSETKFKELEQVREEKRLKEEKLNNKKAELDRLKARILELKELKKKSRKEHMDHLKSLNVLFYLFYLF